MARRCLMGRAVTRRGNLLLGKGHVIASDDMLEALLARGMFVDAEAKGRAR